MDVQLDMKFRNAFIEKYYRSIGKQYSKISYNQNEDSRDDTGYTGCIYVASSAFDGELKEKYKKEEYEKVIQVGTALTSQTINADYFDNDGMIIFRIKISSIVNLRGYIGFGNMQKRII